MGAKRKPGSNLGRALIDWAAAFLFYASLPRDQRSYQAVADKYGVSVRTVERHGRSEQWNLRAQEIDRTAAELASERIRDERADALLDTEKLIQASMVTYASQLRTGSVKITPADIARLHKLRNDIWEQSDNLPADEPPAPQEATVDVDSVEYKLEVVRALVDAGLIQPPEAVTESDGTQIDEGEEEAA